MLLGRALRDGIRLDTIGAADGHALVLAYFADDLAEQRMLTLLAAGLPGGRIPGATVEELRPVLYPAVAERQRAMQGQADAEALFGGPA